MLFNSKIERAVKDLDLLPKRSLPQKLLDYVFGLHIGYIGSPHGFQLNTEIAVDSSDNARWDAGLNITMTPELEMVFGKRIGNVFINGAIGQCGCEKCGDDTMEQVLKASNKTPEDYDDWYNLGIVLNPFSVDGRSKYLKLVDVDITQYLDGIKSINPDNVYTYLSDTIKCPICNGNVVISPYDDCDEIELFTVYEKVVTLYTHYGRGATIYAWDRDQFKQLESESDPLQWYRSLR